MTSKLVEAMARRWVSIHDYEAAMLGDIMNDMTLILAAMCEGEALEEMVERAKAAHDALVTDDWQEYASRTEIRAAIRAALTVQP